MKSQWLLAIGISSLVLFLITADVVGAFVLFHVVIEVGQIVYIVGNVLLVLGVLYAFTRDQPEPDPIKERGIK